MTVLPIDVPDDPRIALFRHVREAELVRSHGLFVAEGRLVVERMLADRRHDVVSLLVNGASLAALEPALARRDADLPVFLCQTALFETITGFNLHRGCLALVRRPPSIAWQDAARVSSMVVVLEGVANPDNVGAVFRNAAAFRAGAVLLSPTCCDPLYRKAIRTSMGAALQVPFARVEPWPEALHALRAGGFTLVALSLCEPSVTLDAFARGTRPDRVALLVGAEGVGLSAGVEACADVRIRIPIDRLVDSLNLAVAAGIALSRLSPL